MRPILIGENDAIRIVRPRTIVGPASVDGVPARVAHQRELEQFSGRAVGEGECLAVVEEPFEGVGGFMGPVLEGVGVGVLA